MILRTGLHGHSGPGVIPGGAMGGGAAVMGGYSQKVLSYGPIAYWPLWEPSGAVAQCLVNPAQNGTYVGVTLGQPGIGDGQTAPFFDGVNDCVPIWSAALVAAFNGSEGSMASWARVNAVGVWTDAASRHVFTLAVDANNRAYYRKDTVANQLHWRYAAGGVTLNRTRAGENTTNWFHIAITWSAAANQVICYFDGVQEGAVLVGLGVFVGALLAANTVIGAWSTAPTQAWHGWLAHCAAWDRPLTPAEVAQLAVV